jgi:hypothetical protein
LDLVYHGYVGDRRTFLPVSLFALLVLEAFRNCLVVLIACRAFPSLVPRKRDLKKLLEGPSRNFWYDVEGDEYHETSVLGADVVLVENST